MSIEPFKLCSEFGTALRFVHANTDFLVSFQLGGGTDSLPPGGLVPPSEGACLYSQPFILPLSVPRIYGAR